MIDAFIEGAGAFVLLLVIYVIGAWKKFEWVTNIKSFSTLLVIFTFCVMAIRGVVDPKDFMLIVSIIMNFYFLSDKKEGDK